MALQSITNINLDFRDPRYLMINAKQYDDCSRQIHITCYDNGELYNFNNNDHVAFVKFKKPDEHFVFDFCEIDYKGIIVVLTEQMLATAGVCEAEIVVINRGTAIIDADTGEITTIDNSSRLATMTFYVNVYETTVDNSVIESTNEFLGLNDTLTLLTADLSDAVQKSKSWAVGGTGLRENEDTNNSMYHSKISESWAVGGTGLEERKDDEDTNNSMYHSKISESWAVGGTGLEERKDDEDTNNSMYHSKVSQSWAVGDLYGSTDVEDRDDEGTDNAEYYSRLSKSYAKGGTGIDERNDEDSNEDTDNALYYSQMSKSYAIGDSGLSERSNEATDNSKYYYGLALENANDASDSADLSKSYAVGGTGTRENESIDNAEYYSRLSKSYAIGDSDGSTGTRDNESTDNAKAYYDGAGIILIAVQKAEGRIEGYETSARGSASAAEDSEKAAKTSAENAAISTHNAAVYVYGGYLEENPNTGEVVLPTEMTGAKQFAEESRVYASKAESFYGQMEAIVNNLNGAAFLPMGTISYSELATLKADGSVKTGYLYNISDSFTTDATFKGFEDKGAIAYEAGTNVYYTADGYWDCLVGFNVASVDEVKNHLKI